MVSRIHRCMTQNKMGGSIPDRQGTLAGAHCDRKYSLIEIVDRHRTAPEREWNSLLYLAPESNALLQEESCNVLLSSCSSNPRRLGQLEAVNPRGSRLRCGSPRLGVQEVKFDASVWFETGRYSTTIIKCSRLAR